MMFLRGRRLLLAAAVAVAAFSHTAFAQVPPATPKPVVQSLGDFGLVVADLDRALAFYRDVLGLKVIAGPTTAVVDAPRNALTDTPGASLRYARLEVPNEPYGLVLEEYEGAPRTASQSNHDDPGSSFLNFGVWDGAVVFDRLRRAAPVVVSAGGIPSGQGGGFQFVWVRDPDGHLTEVMQGGWDGQNKPLVGVGDVYRSHFGMTTGDWKKELAFYRGLLGFDVQAGMPPMVKPGEFAHVGRLGAPVGVPPDATMAAITGHCARAHCEMFEFDGVARRPFAPRFQDPGAAFLSIWVNGLDDVLAKAKAAGLVVITPGGQPVEITAKDRILLPGEGTDAPQRVHHSRQIALRDPSGFPLILAERID